MYRLLDLLGRLYLEEIFSNVSVVTLELSFLNDPKFGITLISSNG